MAILAVLIVAVALTTIFGSSSSAKEQPHSSQRVTRLAATNNDTPNPPISLTCDNLSLTVALFLDRSSSIMADSGKTYKDSAGHPDYGHVPNQYKDTVNDFLQTLYDEIGSQGGKANVLIYAFATRTVLQNPSTQNGTSRAIQTDISIPAHLAAMKTAVDRIYFNRQRKGIDPESASSDPYDVERGYNAGVRTAFGDYGTTNWDDALLNAQRIGASPSYADPAPGKHIDLSIVLTDGKPNLNDGTNRKWDDGDLHRNDSAQVGVNYSASTVTALRLGKAAVSGEPVAPPMAVRSVYITPSFGSNETNAMNQVFGRGNYSSASTFGSDLKAQLEAIIHDVTTGNGCGSVEVVRDLEISANPRSITVHEGDTTGAIVNVVVTNKSQAPMKNVVLTLWSGQQINIGTLSPGASYTYTDNVVLPMGGSLPSQLDYVADGLLSPLSNQHADPSQLGSDPKHAFVATTPVYTALPS
jgi:hypothetical protein